MPELEVGLIRLAAPLHDVGKIALPDTILGKPGKLTDAEFEQMKTHTTVGAQMLAGSAFALLEVAEQVALTHHEKWDGSGYPNGLAGEDIPIAGRIVAVADVFDALTHVRPYKAAWSKADAVAEITNHAGAAFRPPGRGGLSRPFSAGGSLASLVAVSFETAIYQWRAGERRLAEAAPHERPALERVTARIHAELRRRLGGAFTVDELADLYDRGPAGAWTSPMPSPRGRHGHGTPARWPTPRSPATCARRSTSPADGGSSPVPRGSLRSPLPRSQ